LILSLRQVLARGRVPGCTLCTKFDPSLFAGWTRRRASRHWGRRQRPGGSSRLRTSRWRLTFGYCYVLEIEINGLAASREYYAPRFSFDIRHKYSNAFPIEDSANPFCAFTECGRQTSQDFCDGFGTTGGFSRHPLFCFIFLRASQSHRLT
jgi:hypothetical protein